MRRILLFFVFLWPWFILAQEPAIEGDTMLCPQGEGTAYITTDMAYDSYQWQVKPYGEPAYEDIEGETGTSFTYDAYTYSVTYIRVKVTLDGNTYYSNSLLIDSMIFLPITYMTETEGDVVQNAGTWTICNGGTVTNTVGMPYTVVQWYKDGEPIEGATETSYTITEEGVYYAIAHPPACPENSETTLNCVVYECASTNPEPEIEGDTMLCPGMEAIAELTDGTVYDSYQWYAKLDGETEFTAIEGATEDEFLYNANTYALAEIKVVVTLDGETYESNVLFIDVHTWLPIFTASDTFGENVQIDPETGSIILCEGTGFINEVVEPYNTNIQWYRNGQAIEGANGLSYTITEAGTYYVEGAPDYCPFNVSNTSSTPIVVEVIDCTAGIGDNEAGSFTLYPNPVQGLLNITLGNGINSGSYTVFDVTGKLILNGNLDKNENSINVAGLAQGSYIIQVTGEKGTASKLFVRQ